MRLRLRLRLIIYKTLLSSRLFGILIHLALSSHDLREQDKIIYWILRIVVQNMDLDFTCNLLNDKLTHRYQSNIVPCFTLICIGAQTPQIRHDTKAICFFLFILFYEESQIGWIKINSKKYMEIYEQYNMWD